MKNFLIPIILIVSILLTSCQDKGETSLYLSGKENTLPDELKGLKVYSVSTGAGTYVKVAILDGQINSTTYSVGKFERPTCKATACMLNCAGSNGTPTSQPTARSTRQTVTRGRCLAQGRSESALRPLGHRLNN